MLYRDNEGLKLCTKKVIYTQRGEEMESSITTEGVEWWEDFANRWEHTSIVRYEDIEYTPEQLERFEEVKELALGDTVLTEYVLDGVADKELTSIVLKKENEILNAKVDELIEILVEKGVVF